jgi:predicted nuclease of predicted toxin-antitoxin system
MRILLDENLPSKLKFDFPSEYEIHTVKDMGWKGKQNGELLRLIDTSGFDFFITLDKNLRHQQNLDRYSFKFILLVAYNNKHQTLQPLIKKIQGLLLTDNFPKFNEIS